MRLLLPKIALSLAVFILLNSFTVAGPFKRKKKKRGVVCTEYTEKYVDKITGIKRFIAKEKISIDDYAEKNSFDLVWFKSKDEYTLAIKAIDKMCFQHDIAVSFHLLQGKVITCPSSHISNCESLMTVNFKNSAEQDKKVEMLTASEVVGISFDNGRKNYKLKLRPNQASVFQQTIKCLKERS